MNMITMLVMSAPPAGPVPGQYPNPQGYPQYQPYPHNPYQQAAPVPQPQVQQPSQQRQTQQGQLMCWSCRSPGAKFCPQYGVSLQEVKCPQLFIFSAGRRRKLLTIPTFLYYLPKVPITIVKKEEIQKVRHK